jgi:hypothetical protein
MPDRATDAIDGFLSPPCPAFNHGYSVKRLVLLSQ